MREPVVLTQEEVDSEVARLGAEVRAARQAAQLSTREAAARARMAQSSLWRLEAGKNAPRLWQFGRLVHALGLRMELDDGADRPRRPLPANYLWPGGETSFWASDRVEQPWVAATDTDTAADVQGDVSDVVVDLVRQRIGAELAWARQHQLTRPLSEAAASELLGMSHHTLHAVEGGLTPDMDVAWPYLTSVIRVAGLTGRRLALCDADADPRLPPWIQVG